MNFINPSPSKNTYNKNRFITNNQPELNTSKDLDSEDDFIDLVSTSSSINTNTYPFEQNYEQLPSSAYLNNQSVETLSHSSEKLADFQQQQEKQNFDTKMSSIASLSSSHISTTHAENNLNSQHSSTVTTSAPNIKVIPIAIKTPGIVTPQRLKNKNRISRIPSGKFNQNQSLTDISTVSTIEDLLAEKVEKIANHLEAANSNILQVDGKIKNLKETSLDNLGANNEILNDLKDQIQDSVRTQQLLNRNLSQIGNNSGPILLPSQAPKNHQAPNLSTLNNSFPTNNQTTEDDHAFLARLRAEADFKVNEAIRLAENNQNKITIEKTMDKLTQFLDAQNNSTSKNAEQIILQAQKEQSKLRTQSNAINAKTKKLNEMLADLSIEKQNLEKELQMHKNERQNLHTDLFTAKSEIKSLKDELNNLKIQLQNQNHQTSEKSYQNQMQKQKLDESTNLNYSYLNEISVLKQTLERMSSERADLDNEVTKLKSEVGKMRHLNGEEIRNLVDKHQSDLNRVRLEHEKRLKELQNANNMQFEERLQVYWFWLVVLEQVT